jgi:hypothetical protein
MPKINRQDYLAVMRDMVDSTTTLSVHAMLAFKAHEPNLPHTAVLAIAKSGVSVSEVMANNESMANATMPTTDEEHLNLLVALLDAVKHCELVFGAIRGTLTSEEEKQDNEVDLANTQVGIALIQTLAEIEVPN